jgi:hypothetical protein
MRPQGGFSQQPQPQPVSLALSFSLFLPQFSEALSLSPRLSLFLTETCCCLVLYQPYVVQQQNQPSVAQLQNQPPAVQYQPPVVQSPVVQPVVQYQPPVVHQPVVSFLSLASSLSLSNMESMV